ncbi:hypothetical protein ACF0H5_018914 [Mactra antiquata]
MKVTIFALAFVAAVVMVQAEECLDTGDCSHVACPENDYVLECVHRQCTCTHTTATCALPTECSGNCNNDWHCIDGKCRCGFGFGGNEQ